MLDNWLTRLLTNYLKEEQRFLEIPGEPLSPTFDENELQMASTMAPALRASSSQAVVYLELPYDKKERISSKGTEWKWKTRRLDYWLFDGRRTFGLELKDGRLNVEAASEGGFDPSTQRQLFDWWNVVTSQAKRLDKFVLTAGTEVSRYKIAALVLRLYEKTREEWPSFDPGTLLEITLGCAEFLALSKGGSPDWIGLWLPGENELSKTRWKGKRKKSPEVYPGCAFIFKITKS
jgi:hypothetical protein